LHSEFARDRYAALGVEAGRLLVAHNGYDPRAFEPRVEPSAARREVGLPADRPLVVYTGHINATKGLDVVLGMAKRCPGARFVLVGSEGDGLIERLARGADNVTLVPWQPGGRVVRYLFAADVLLLPPSGVPLRLVGNTVLPMKLFLYLAAGRPILAPDGPDLAELLEDDDNAVLVPPGDVAAAAAALRDLLADGARRARLSEAARRTSVGLTWDARAAKIERFLEDRLSEHQP
jgi:glycosyltransferase involved in cell wall biosynthesis